LRRDFVNFFGGGGAIAVKDSKEEKIRANEQIRAREVRVIDAEGRQLGIMSLRDALAAARERDLDLVEVAPNAKPPVCRIMDLGKFKYQQKKKAQAAKKKQHIIQVKEVRMRPKIEEHDYQVKLKHLRRFLEEGNKAKINVRFRGRELAFVDAGRQVLNRIIHDLSDVAVVEKLPDMEGRSMIMVLAPKSMAKSSSS